MLPAATSAPLRWSNGKPRLPSQPCNSLSWPFRAAAVPHRAPRRHSSSLRPSVAVQAPPYRTRGLLSVTGLPEEPIWGDGTMLPCCGAWPLAFGGRCCPKPGRERSSTDPSTSRSGYPLTHKLLRSDRSPAEYGAARRAAWPAAGCDLLPGTQSRQVYRGYRPLPGLAGRAA